jgi:predicted aspartyl protease
MAQIYSLELIKPDDIILTEVLINRHKASLVLDTGATHTVIDINTLIIAGYPFVSSGKKKFETANGIIEVDKIHLIAMTIWGKTFSEVDIYALDFIEAGITSPYEGVLGLDLMKQFCITLDFKGRVLRIE